LWGIKFDKVNVLSLTLALLGSGPSWNERINNIKMQIGQWWRNFREISSPVIQNKWKTLSKQFQRVRQKSLTQRQNRYYQNSYLLQTLNESGGVKLVLFSLLVKLFYFVHFLQKWFKYNIEVNHQSPNLLQIAYCIEIFQNHQHISSAKAAMKPKLPRL